MRRFINIGGFWSLYSTYETTRDVDPARSQGELDAIYVHHGYPGRGEVTEHKMDRNESHDV